MTWMPLTAEHVPTLRPRPADRPHVGTYDPATGQACFATPDPADFQVYDPLTGYAYTPTVMAGQLGFDPADRIVMALGETPVPLAPLQRWLAQDPSAWQHTSSTTPKAGWLVAMHSQLTDAELIGLWQALPPGRLQAIHAEEPSLLGETFWAGRPQLADWFWEQGLRLEGQRLYAHAFQPIAEQMWQHLGGRPLAYHDRLPTTAGAYADHTGVAMLARVASTWQGRLSRTEVNERLTLVVMDEGREKPRDEQHSPASFLVAGACADPSSWHDPIIGAQVQANQASWLHWLDLHGFDWSRGGISVDDGPRDCLASYAGACAAQFGGTNWADFIAQRVAATRLTTLAGVPSSPTLRPRHRV